MMPTYGIPLHLKNKIKQIGYNEMDRQGELRFWKWLAVIGWLLFFLLLGLYFFPDLEAKEITSPAIWKVLLAEGANQGYDGMYAIACVIRNRGGDLNGFVGAYRKDLDAFCNRQGKRYIEMAQRIETSVFKKKAPDITQGATHYENEMAFGKPYWAKGMVVVARIGKHVFYKYLLNRREAGGKR